MNSTRERVNEILISGFPHWSQVDVNGMTRFLFWFFEEHVKHDSNYVVAAASELWSYTKERAQTQGKAWNEIRPGYVRYPLTNWGSVAVRFKNLYSDNNLLKIAKRKRQDLQHYVMMQKAFELIPEFNPSSTLEKVVGFIKEIELSVRFTKAQAPVWYTMKEVAQELAGETVEDFWEEVELRCLENNIHMSDANWRQIKRRIRDKINTQARGSEGMLQMVSGEELALRKLLNVVEWLDKQSQNKAYRFSKMELDGVIKLSKLFLENKFTTERFPEVYEGEIPERSKEEQKLIDLGSDGILQLVEKSWIDALGVYRMSPPIMEEDKSYQFAKEGHIIIDTKKIEQWVEIWNNKRSDEKLTVDNVRFVVLMHELGHWFSHWPIGDGEKTELRQWNPGFEFPNRMTKEALANIICLWACEDTDLKEEEQRRGLLKALDALTPKDKNGNVDTSNAYGAYELLKPFERSTILEKLNTLRANWMLKDEFLFDFLKSEETDIFKWLGDRNPEEVSLNGFDHKLNYVASINSVWSKTELGKSAKILNRSGSFYSNE